MRHWIIVIILIGTFVAGGSAAGKGPEITLIDSKLSISADSISLGRLLRLLDQATGMQSKVPREFADRNLSVRFSGLSFDQAVRKIFQGQPFDYVVIGGQGIIITGSSQTLSASDSPPPQNTPPAQPLEQTFVQDDPPFIPQPVQLQPQVGVQPVPGFVPPPGAVNNPFGQQQQPQVIQTPFGPIPNPRANQGLQPNGNLSVPGGQQNPFGTPFGGSNPSVNPNSTGQNELFGNAPAFQNQNPQGATPPSLFQGQTPQRRP
jgi:hypothetical protein